MSVRNIRAHQSRRLIPEPERRGRSAYYGPAHERALRRIKALQDEGYNLAAVEKLMREDRSRDAELQRLVLAPLLEDDEILLTREQMMEMFGLQPDDGARLRHALSARLLRDAGSGRYAVASGELLQATAALVAKGLSIVDVYGMQLEISRATQDVAKRFVAACIRASGELDPDALSPATRDEVRQRFEELRDQFTLVLATTFAVNVRLASEDALAAEDAATAAPSGSTRRSRPNGR